MLEKPVALLRSAVLPHTVISLPLRLPAWSRRCDRRRYRVACHTVLAGAEEPAHQRDGMKAVFGEHHTIRRRMGDHPLTIDAVVLRQRPQVPYDLAFSVHYPAVHLVRQRVTLQPAP